MRPWSRYHALGNDYLVVDASLWADLRCRVLSGGREVEVAMGRVSFDSREIPVQGPPREVLREQLIVHDRTLEFSAATLGNPHCVMICDEVAEGTLHEEALAGVASR
jgi:diaminopimelate epimerase